MIKRKRISANLRENYENRLLDFRLFHKLTQSEAGKKAGLIQTAVGRYERGTEMMSVFSALALAEAYGVQVEDLFVKKTSNKDVRPLTMLADYGSGKVKTWNRISKS